MSFFVACLACPPHLPTLYTSTAAEPMRTRGIHYSNPPPPP